MVLCSKDQWIAALRIGRVVLTQSLNGLIGKKGRNLSALPKVHLAKKWRFGKQDDFKALTWLLRDYRKALKWKPRKGIHYCISRSARKQEVWTWPCHQSSTDFGRDRVRDEQSGEVSWHGKQTGRAWFARRSSSFFFDPRNNDFARAPNSGYESSEIDGNTPQFKHPRTPAP